MVEVLSGYGIPAPKIAGIMGCGVSTLYRTFAQELDRGRAKVEAALIGNLFRLAAGTDGTALKAIVFSLQTRFGWSQYVPRPATEAPPGKKEKAQIDAEEPPDPDTGWDVLLQ